MPCPCKFNPDLVRDLANHLSETVTIYTTSGGVSGSGFTGVLINVTCDFARLLSDIGPAPACALGSCCDKKHHKCHSMEDEDDFNDDEEEENTRIDCRGRNVGAVVDIPIRSIAAFVHNTLR